jgi:type III secretory pathway component EscS
MFYSTRYFIRLLVIVVIAIIIYERYEYAILNFGKNIVSALKTLIPR